MLDSTLEVYRRLCERIVTDGYQVWPVAHYLTAETRPDYVVLLRHDIDRRPRAALRMAELEHSMGLRATYYVRILPWAFCTANIEEIAGMGHEVGLHYETLSRAHGDYTRAIGLFQDQPARLRQVREVRIITMHAFPLSPYDKTDLWQKIDILFHPQLDAVASALALSFQQSSFDLVSFLANLNCLGSPIQAMSKALRGLEEDRRIVLTMINPVVRYLRLVLRGRALRISHFPGAHIGLWRKEVVAQAESAGLRLVHQLHFCFGLNRVYVLERKDPSTHSPGLSMVVP